MYLSHAGGSVFLQKASLGAGELQQYWIEYVARSDIKCCFRLKNLSTAKLRVATTLASLLS